MAANLQTPLAVEAKDDLSWENGKQIRALNINQLDRTTPVNKSLHRQISDNDTARNHLEKILRSVNKLTVVGGTDVDKFTDTTKKELQESVRAALLQNYEQKQFLSIAKEHGFGAADHFKASAATEDEGTLTADMKKRVEETKKKYGESSQKKSSYFPKQQQQPGYNFNQPHSMVSSALQAQPHSMVSPALQTPQQFYSSSIPSYMMQPQFHAQGNLMSQAQQGNLMSQAQQAMNNFTAQQFQSQAPGPFPTRFRGRFPRPPIDKSNSTCKACGLLGHWAGDAVCTLSGFPKQQPNNPVSAGQQQVVGASHMLALTPPNTIGQPPPPGSG